MGILSFLGKQQEPDEDPKQKRKTSFRRYGSSVIDRLTQDFKGSMLTANGEIEASLRVMRGRSRQLAMDNDYASKFLKMVKANVVGVHGIQLQARSTREDGSLDKLDNDAIEASFKEWSLPENCSVTGRLSWVDIQRLVVESCARDGEVLVIKVRGFNNAFGFAVQIVEADHLDEDFNLTLTNGNRIIMSVEVNEWNAPVAYHLLTDHPNETSIMHKGRKYNRVPANDVCHLFITERASQLRGVPWMNTAMKRLNMVSGYEEAELIAARIGASKMGFYTSPDSDAYVGEEDESGNLVTDMEPGVFEQLPAGMSVQTFDPSHPNSAYQVFIKTVLRGASSGLNVAYNGLANDLEGVNFSSIRSGVLEEREHWRILQKWVSDQLHRPVYQAWLSSALRTQELKLPEKKFKKFTKVNWQPRGWAWVDPLKDQQANKLSIEMGTGTLTSICAAAGLNFIDVCAERKAELAVLESFGLTPNDILTPNKEVDDNE